MIKPKHLRKGDTVAIVSTSSGMLGEPWAIHKLDIAKKRLEDDYGLNVVVMPNALKGIDYLYNHPELRAKDLMDAFKDPNIKGIFNAIGGDDSIRLLPYIDYEIIKNNPKIFTGFSDTTCIHMMLHKAGLISYYGASVMTNISEYVKINDYTQEAILNTIFEPKDNFEIKSSPYYYDANDERIEWGIENINTLKPYHKEEIGYEVLQGSGVVEGELLGGCADVFIELLGTKVWPSVDEWKDKILFMETSTEDLPADHLVLILRNLAAQGIFKVIKGVIVGKPAVRDRYEEYKEIYKKVIGVEENRKDLPIFYNVNVGHAEPIGIFPIGVKCRLDTTEKKITLLEKASD